MVKKYLISMLRHAMALVMIAGIAAIDAGGQSQSAGQSTIDDQQSVAITVYNSNLGLVKDTRTLRLPRGASQLRFMDVAQLIDPTTVHIKSLTAPNSLQVVEQSYEYDLLNPQKLLDKYVGREMTLVLRRVENNSERLVPVQATLLSNNAGQVWRIENQIVINPTNVAEMRFEQLPVDLIAKPTLVWSLNNAGADSHRVEASYLTTGLNWRADYVVVVNQDDTKADLNGWVTLDNRSGAAYRNAELKLVAGDVQRVRDVAKRELEMMRSDRPAAALLRRSFRRSRSSSITFTLCSGQLRSSRTRQSRSTFSRGAESESRKNSSSMVSSSTFRDTTTRVSRLRKR